MTPPTSHPRSGFTLAAALSALGAIAVSAIIASASSLWARSGWWGLSTLFAVVWALELSALALASRRTPLKAIRLATLGALLGAGSLLIAGAGLLGARLAAESSLSFAHADTFTTHWALHERLAALHSLTLTVGAALLIPFIAAEVTLWWVVRRRERDVARGDMQAAHESTTPRLLEVGASLLLFAAGAGVIATSYAAPVPYAERPEKARLSSIQTAAASHDWDAACSQLRTAVRNNGAPVVKHDLPGAGSLARLCIQGRITRLSQAGIACNTLVAGNEPLASLAGGGRKVVAMCRSQRTASRAL